MKKIIISGMVVLSISTFNGCKKYDEGPAISLRSKKERVVAEWEVKSYTDNGQNILVSSYSDNLTCQSGGSVHYTETYNTTRFVWTFYKNGKWNYQITSSDKTLDYNTSSSLCGAYYDNTTDNQTENGTWKFISDKEKLELFYNSGGTIETWEIKELREKEMKLEMVNGADTYKVTLSKR